jgi:glycosyltransferase involved in cell wall biosynthesis
MSEASVSVIVPTHNRSRLLPRALTSLARQTRPPTEVIVVDDGSTDGTASLVERDFPGVRYLRQDNRGVAAARNLGIGRARGEWLAFLDSDDEWLPHKLDRQMRALAEPPERLICHSDELWVRHGKRVNPMKKHAKHGGRIFSYCLPLCTISPSSVVLHRSVLEKTGLFDESLPACEDYDLWLRVCSVLPVLYLDEPLIIKYGGHPDQLSRRFWGMDRFRIRALEKLLQSDSLSVADRRAVARTLVGKIDVYLAGARKRAKWEEVNVYRTRRDLYARLLEEWVA